MIVTTIGEVCSKVYIKVALNHLEIKCKKGVFNEFDTINHREVCYDCIWFISKWHEAPIIARGGAIGDPNYAYLYKWIGYS